MTSINGATPKFHNVSTELTKIDLLIPQDKRETIKKELAGLATTDSSNIDKALAGILENFPAGIRNIVKPLLRHLADKIAEAKASGKSEAGIIVRDSVSGSGGASPHTVSVDMSFLDRPHLPALDREIRSLFLQSQSTHTSTHELEQALERLVSALQHGETDVPPLKKDAQLWMFSVAVELFLVGNLIIKLLAQMKKEWNEKLTDLKKVMLTMAKDMLTLAQEAGKARSQQLLAEADSLLAEGIMSFVTAAVQLGTYGMQQVEEHKDTSRTEKDLYKELKAEQKRNESSNDEIKQKRTDAKERLNTLETEKKGLYDRQNTLKQEKQELINQKARLTQGGAPGEVVAVNEKDMKKVTELINAKDTDLATNQDAMNAKQTELSSAIDEIYDNKDTREVAIRYRLDHKSDPSMNVISEEDKYRAAQTRSQKYTTFKDILTSVVSGTSSMVKSEKTAERAALEMEAASTEALNQFLGRIFQMLQESTSTLQSAQESISKNVENMIELMKSAQALQSRQ